jgi:hypothetical protein
MDMLVTYPQPSLENLGKYYECGLHFAYGQKKILVWKTYHFVKKHSAKKKLRLINSLQPAKEEF